MKRFIALFWLACSICSAADITIRVPSAPIKPGAFVMLEIVGLNPADLKSSKASITPSEGVQFFPAKLWNDQPYLFFQSAVPGTYTVDISVNRWKGHLDEGLAGATESKIDSATLAELNVVVARVGTKYPTKSGTAVLVVAGKVPPVDPPPVDPDDPPVDPNPKRIDRVTYVYEKDSNITPKPVAFALQRLNTEYKDVIASEFEEDSVDGTGEVPEQYKIALEAARKSGLPALVIQAGNTVVKILKAPKTEAEVMNEVLK